MLTEEHKRKISETNKRKCISPPRWWEGKNAEAIKNKIAKSNTGKKKSAETKRKLSISSMGNKSILGKCGKLSNNWKGGISNIDRMCRQISEYKRWRSDVFERDSWTCQTCGERGYVTAHHINGFSKIIKENDIHDINEARGCEELWNINNGVTLCEECHSMTDNYGGRAKKTT